MRVSAGADWGNVRYGKGFRAEANFNTLRPFIQESVKLLDIGASRGAFLNLFHQHYPSSTLVGIEPDASVVDWADKFTWWRARLEYLQPDESFDIVYSSHTLEHLPSAKAGLIAHHGWLKPDGYMLLEVPNTAICLTDDITNEYFIDKHSFHFTENTLRKYLALTGFRIIVPPDPKDLQYLTVVARKI